MVQIRWTDQAVEDLNGLYMLISRDSPRYAQLFVERILKAIDRLETFPNSGRSVPEAKDLKEILVGSYRIIYRMKRSDLVEIITLFHGAKLFDPIGMRRRGRKGI